MGTPGGRTEDRLHPLYLDETQLGEIRDTLARRIGAGLEQPEQEIRALPAWLPRPRPGLEGRTLVMDTGGTNMRAALVRIHPDGTYAVEKGPVQARVPTGRGGQPVPGAEFFAAQAGLLGQLSPEPGLPLGYCFSYPAEITPDADARLIHWTKGVEVSGVEGNLVGRPLAEAMAAAGFGPSRVHVLNDTVAALLAGAGQHAGHFQDFVGLIAGTGTNMAGFFEVSRISKLSGVPFGHRDMAVNLESGNYHPPHLSAWDEALNQALDRPGTQRVEKAVSGYYLPFLFREVCPEIPKFVPTHGSAQLVALRGAETGGEAAGALLGRAADLVAAGLAGLLQASGTRGRVGIVAEGSLFWGDPEFRPRVEKTLKALVAPGTSCEVLHVADANLLGSAYAALL